jgi:hypothetical protein
MSGIIAQNSGRHTGLIKAASGGGSWNLILTQTASSSATISFTSGIDSTYNEYVFKFHNIHPSGDNKSFSFQGNAAAGSGYNETMTSTFFETYHTEAGDATSFTYKTSGDQAQGTGFQLLCKPTHENDNGVTGMLHLFNPSSTTFVKHWLSRTQTINSDTYSVNDFTAGYFNTTSAIDEIQFKMSAGNMDTGTISLYGIT